MNRTSLTHLFSHLEKVISGSRIIQCPNDQPVGEIAIDTRTIMAKPHAIFLAIRGQNHNGHSYIADAYRKGIRQFIVEKGSSSTYDRAALKDANILEVEKAIPALQAYATHHRNQFPIPLLAITGSNGKTIIKEWLGTMLEKKYHVIQSPKSYNSQIGVPLSVLMIDPTYTFGVFEAGISQPHEMEKLAPILHPTLGIFSNIGTAHDEGFESMEQKCLEKAKLFSSCEKILYCKDHTLVSQTLEKEYTTTDKTLISWSMKGRPATYTIEKQAINQTRTLLKIKHLKFNFSFEVPFQDQAYLENAIHCIVFLLEQGFSTEDIQQSLLQLRPVAMRLTLKQGINRCQIIDDTYNNDLAGLEVALDFMLQQNTTLKRAVILSDFLQTRLSSDKLYQQVATLLRSKGVDTLIGIGPEMKKQHQAFAELTTHFFEDTSSCLAYEVLNQLQDSLVLIKGARKFELEDVVAHLQQKIHHTVMEVDLNAVAHNLNYFRQKLNRGTKLMVMTKASTYGSGTFEVAHLLQHHKVDYLGVAYTDEGVALRENGITCPIMVLNPTGESFDKLTQFNLEPEIYSIRLLKALIDFTTNNSTPLNIHLKINTGMNRLGFEEEDLPTLIDLLKTHPHLYVQSIFSHLAGSEDVHHDQYTHHQAAQLQKLAHPIEEGLSIKPMTHLLNSSGILRFPDYQFDMVRLGIGLYGVGVEEASALEIVNTLKTVISQIRKVKKGTTIGYGRMGKAVRDTTVATIAIGYADGFLRGLGNGKGSVLIHGKLAPVIGNVCMDMCMVDITDIPAQEGDEVIIFGKERPIADISQALHTSPYETLTNVSDRVKRIFYS